MDKTKILILFVILFSSLVLTPNITAYQEKMTVKECYFSYNDNSFSSWNETEGKGIFMKINNSNLNLGALESPSYLITYYQNNQQPRAYYNNFNYGGNSTYPILDVKTGQENLVYIKCIFKIGNYRVYPNDFYYMYGGNGDGLKLTHDFNLTQEIIYPGMANYNYYTTNSNGILVNFSFYAISSYKVTDSNYYVDNKVDALPGYLYQGFYPNTEPYVLNRINLSDSPSGIFRSYSLIREGNSVMLFYPFYTQIYVNSSIKNVSDYLLPIFREMIVKNENTSIVYNSSTGTQRFLINYGDVLNTTITYKNDFNTEINVSLYNHFFSQAAAGGLSYSGCDVTSYNLLQAENNIIIPALGYYSFQNKLIFPDKSGGKYVVAPSPFFALDVITKAGTVGGSSFIHAASDNNSYLGFRKFDPRIEIMKIAGEYKPVFKMITTLLVVDNVAWNSEVYPGDYELIVELWNSSYGVGNPKDSFTYLLGEPEFIQMGKTCPGVNCKLVEDVYDYTVTIPHTNEYIEEGANGVKYNVMAYTKKKTDPFKDLKMASLQSIPYFTPGEIAYQLDNILNFGLGSRVDSEKIILFNPTFYDNDIDLNVSKWSDYENFTISFDGINFEKNPSETIHLLPLQSKEITFWVNATYEPWVLNPITENLEIKAHSFLNTGTGTPTEKTNYLNFILDVSNESITWFNLNPLDYYPDRIYIGPGLGQVNKDINVTWKVEASESGFNNNLLKNYSVNLKLKDSSGLLKKEITKKFTINENYKEESMMINYTFRTGNYNLEFRLDSEGDITETESSGSERETENDKSYPVIVYGNCFYNSSNGYMYYTNEFMSLVKDTNCKCQCPYELTCVDGVGFCASTSGKCNDILTINTCNDWSAHTDFALCGWECENGNCPPNPNIASGICQNCSDILNSCGGYNNDVTCNLDPCEKRLSDCNGLECDSSLDYGCFWDSDNKCKFNGTINGDYCIYNSQILKECGGLDVDFMTINFIGSPNPPCEDKKIDYPCGDVVKLGFFDLFNILEIITILIIFYCLFIIKRR